MSWDQRYVRPIQREMLVPSWQEILLFDDNVQKS